VQLKLQGAVPGAEDTAAGNRHGWVENRLVGDLVEELVDAPHVLYGISLLRPFQASWIARSFRHGDGSRAQLDRLNEPSTEYGPRTLALALELSCCCEIRRV